MAFVGQHTFGGFGGLRGPGPSGHVRSSLKFPEYHLSQSYYITAPYFLDN